MKKYLMMNENGQYCLSEAVPNQVFDEMEKVSLDNTQVDFEVVDHEIDSKCLQVLVEGTNISRTEWEDVDSTHIKFKYPINKGLRVKSILIGYSNKQSSGGSSGVDIDDSAPSINKVYSSSHVQGEINNIKNVLNSLLYKPIVINSFSNNVNIVETGATVDSVNFNWILSKQPQLQSINNGIGSLGNDLRSYTLKNQNIIIDTTFELTVADEKNTVNFNTSILFRDKIFSGISKKEDLTESEIKALNGYFAEDISQNKTFDCSGGKYIYFAFPTNITNEFIFSSGGFSFAVSELSQIEITNTYGHKQLYRVFRSTNLMNASSIPIKVSSGQVVK